MNLEVSDDSNESFSADEEEDDTHLEDNHDEIEHGIDQRIDELSPIDKTLVKVWSKSLS